MTAVGRFVLLRETPQGGLDLVLTEFGRREFHAVDAVRQRYGNRVALKFLLDDHLRNRWEFVLPQELGAWTSAPMLSREIERDIDGTIVRAGRVYWQSDYPIVDCLSELRRRGFAEFRGVG